MPLISSTVNPFVLIDKDGRHRIPTRTPDGSGQLKYQVGTGQSGTYDLVDDLEVVLQRVLLYGKTVAAKRVGAPNSSSTGVKVPGRSIAGYWLAADLREKFLAAVHPPLNNLPDEPSLSKPARDGFGWTDDELKAAVLGYMSMLADQRGGFATNKKALYRSIATRLQRSISSVDRRMQNISLVLALMGRVYVKGLLPASNTGAEVAGRLESFILELENRPKPPTAAFEEQVSKLLKRRLATPPQGIEKPVARIVQTTVFDRDPGVKAWVLQRANGRCEACPNSAPFVRADGTPYLEVHHLRPLAEGGSDKPCNAVAICPNCHRWLHYGRGSESVRNSLMTNVKGLVEE